MDFFKLIGLICDIITLLQHAFQVASLVYLAFSSGVYMKPVFLKGGDQFCP